ncbi:unnamed protein product [Arctogadus glacialis]
MAPGSNYTFPIQTFTEHCNTDHGFTRSDLDFIVSAICLGIIGRFPPITNKESRFTQTIPKGSIKTQLGYKDGCNGVSLDCHELSGENFFKKPNTSYSKKKERHQLLLLPLG